MFKWLRKLLGLEETPKPEPKPGKAVTIEVPAGEDLEARELVKLFEGKAYRSIDIRRKPPSLLEISKRKHPDSQKDELPRSFSSRSSVKQAQVNLKKVGYRKDAKIEEDPPRKRRW